jgi:uncharacterized protein
MIANSFAGIARAALAALTIAAATTLAQAQQPPSANAIALAKDIIIAKGANNLYEPLIPGVIERAKATFIQSNPMLQKDLDEVAVRLRNDMKSRSLELSTEFAKIYAARFSEQELKEVLAFYKSTAGKKVINLEPEIIDSSVDMLKGWHDKFAEEMMVKFRAEMKKKGHDL